MYLYSKIIELSNANIWERLFSWYQNSLIKELFEYVGKHVFRVNFGTYDNISVGAGADSAVRNVILGLMFGMIVAACAMAYTRIVHGRFIRTLLRREALSPDRAITLREAGMFRNPSVRSALLGGVLSKLTRCVETEEFVASQVSAEAPSNEAEQSAGDEPADSTETEGTDLAETSVDEKTTEANGEKASAEARGLVVVEGFTPDLLTARFYIPEDLKYRAEVRYERRGSGIPQLILTIVVCVAIAVLLCRFLPSLLALADRLINVFA